MIYFAQIDIPNGPIKIGCARNPEKRVRRLQTHMPWRLKLLKTFDGDYKIENEIHHRCRRYKIIDSNGREWFDPIVLKFLDFLDRIKQKNLTAEKQMTAQELKEYLDILMDCVQGAKFMEQGEWKSPEKKEHHQDKRFGGD